MRSGTQTSIRFAAGLLAIVALASITAPARAELRTFYLDSSQSSLTVTGNLYGETYQPQGDGSLTTSFAGTFEVDIASGSVQFVGGSVIIAGISGDWMPQAGAGGGSFPANFGGLTDDVQSGLDVNFFLATRDLRFDLTSAAIPMNDGEFSAGGIQLSITQGSTDWTMINKADQQPVLFGNSSLVGQGGTTTGGVGQRTNQGYRLTVPIDVSIPIDANGNGTIDSAFNLTGQLVGNARVPGDYNGDGNVDGADFVIWQTTFPGTWPLDADGNGDGVIDGADFVIWQTNFPFIGDSPGAPTAVVPEPSAGLLALLAVGMALIARRRCAC